MNTEHKDFESFWKDSSNDVKIDILKKDIYYLRQEINLLRKALVEIGDTVYKTGPNRIVANDLI